MDYSQTVLEDYGFRIGKSRYQKEIEEEQSVRIPGWEDQGFETIKLSDFKDLHGGKLFKDA